MLDQVDLAGLGSVGRVNDGPLLDLGDFRGDTNDDPGVDQQLSTMGLADEVGQHPFGDLEIGDDTVLQRTDGNDVGRGASHHVLGVPPHGFHLVRVFVDSHDGGLIDHNPLSLGKHQRVGRAQVNGEVAGKEVEGSSKDHSVASSSLALGRVHRCSTVLWLLWEKG